MIVDCSPQIVNLRKHTTFQSEIIKKWLNPNLTCGTGIMRQVTSINTNTKGGYYYVSTSGYPWQ
jgi:hypothetical protein